MEHKPYLYHWGIKGMRWGVRRYQNKDGTLTPAGKNRYDRDADAGGYKNTDEIGMRYRTTKKGKREIYDPDVHKWVKEDLTRSRKLVTESESLSRNLKTASDTFDKNRSRPKMDLSNMTDKQMRDQINRALLERQYDDLFNPKKTSRGKEYVDKIFTGTTAVLGVTASALGIALAIKELRHG